jgi:hypothetical protein
MGPDFFGDILKRRRILSGFPLMHSASGLINQLVAGHKWVIFTALSSDESFAFETRIIGNNFDK